MIADNRIHSISLMYIIIANNLFLTFLFKIPGADIVSNPAENFPCGLSDGVTKGLRGSKGAPKGHKGPDFHRYYQEDREKYGTRMGHMRHPSMNS
jgi:hypothetical protein